MGVVLIVVVVYVVMVCGVFKFVGVVCVDF